MKQINILLALAAMSAAIISCSDIDEYKVVDPDSGTELALTASASELVLNEKNASSDALSLEWTTGTNKGTGNAITYKIEFASDGQDYSEGYSEELGRKAYSYSFTTKALNSFVKENFGAASGVAASYKARVTASVADHDELEQTSEVTIRVTPYEPVSTTLYMIGDATSGGWSVDNPTEMNLSGTGTFTWTGNLSAGSFRFITTKGNFWPGYTRDGNDESGLTMKYFASQPEDSSEDLSFSVPETGGYKISADLLNLVITIEEANVNEPPYSTIYFVSEANSWSFIEMTQDPINPFIFRYGAEIGNGQFKFGTSAGSWENMYKTDYDNADISNTTVVFVSGYDPDYKWLLYADEQKAYKIALDITPYEESMVMKEYEPYGNLWLIGDAAPYGWSLDDAASGDKAVMSPGSDPYTMTWTGNLSAGELKISCELQRDWCGCWFMPSSAGKPFGETTDEIITFVDSSSDSNDRKWAVETAGNYTITINQLTERMTVVKN